MPSEEGEVSLEQCPVPAHPSGPWWAVPGHSAPPQPLAVGAPGTGDGVCRQRGREENCPWLGNGRARSTCYGADRLADSSVRTAAFW